MAINEQQMKKIAAETVKKLNAVGKSDVDALVSRRDALICQLWLVYRDMSDLLEADDFDAADLDLWGKVTAHAAVQSKLGG